LCFLASGLTGAGGRKLRLLMERWKMSLSAAAVGAKSLATIALVATTERKTRNAVQPYH
jgi:hypothetical protein